MGGSIGANSAESLVNGGPSLGAVMDAVTDGIVFLDRMTDMTTLTFLPEYSRYWTSDDE